MLEKKNVNIDKLNKYSLKEEYKKHGFDLTNAEIHEISLNSIVSLKVVGLISWKEEKRILKRFHKKLKVDFVEVEV